MDRYSMNDSLGDNTPGLNPGVAGYRIWTAIVPDEPYRAKGAGSRVGLYPTLHVRRCLLLIIPLVVRVSCSAYRAHSTRLLQPRTSASAYGGVEVLDIANGARPRPHGDQSVCAQVAPWVP